MAATIQIDRRFNGPPDSANGGYTCGCVATALGGPVEVSLRRPPPLERSLSVAVEGDEARLLDGDELVADGSRVEPGALGDPAVPVSVEDAREAATRSFYLEDAHPFPTCFVCGPRRADGDGLRIFAGPLGAGGDLFAAPWVPPVGLAREDGTVAPEVVWAALDCPSSAPGMNAPGPDGRVLPIVLARLAAEVSAPVEAGAEHVVMSWEIGHDGRKREAGAALYDRGGELLARARALWIELKPA